MCNILIITGFILDGLYYPKGLGLSYAYRVWNDYNSQNFTLEEYFLSLTRLYITKIYLG